MSTRFQSTLLGDLDVKETLKAKIGASTYFKIGGCADLLVHPGSTDSLSMLLQRCHNEETPFRVLGRGANLLVDDVGVDGVVVKLDHPCFNQFRFNNEDSENELHVMGGKDLAPLLMEAARCGFQGLDAMAGIPATIGGAIRMNAGGVHGCISDALRTVTCLTDRGELVTYDKKSISFGYRDSGITDPIILSATFELQECDPVVVRDHIKEIFAWKSSRQPLADSSAGCAFKNPKDEHGQRISAGKLIDEAGLKGHSVGGATISDRHANFIITKPNTSANDVLTLMSQVRDRVHDSTGIVLQREVVVWSRNLEVQR